MFVTISLTSCSNSNALVRTAEKLAILSVCKSFIPCLNSRTLARFAYKRNEDFALMSSVSAHRWSDFG